MSNLLLLALLFFACSYVMAQDATQIDPGPIVIPPEWLLTILDKLAALPLVGPYVATAVQWAGVIAVILTGLVSFLTTALKALMKVMELAQLVKASEFLKKIEDSKVMYWLRAFSNLPPKKQVESK